MERIIINVNKTGEITVKPDGMKGTKCKDATKELEKALGSTIKDVKTGEYYAQDQTGSNQVSLS